jgi:putative inorganic carbon (HCO3(-)) transporter
MQSVRSVRAWFGVDRGAPNAGLTGSLVIVLTAIVGGYVTGHQLVNPILMITAILYTIGALVASSNLGQGLQIYLLILPFSYILKRLLFVWSDVPQAEWFIASVLPDVILATLALHLLYRIWIEHDTQSLPRRAIDPLLWVFILWTVLEVANPGKSLSLGIAGFKKSAFYILMYFLGIAVVQSVPRIFEKVTRITLIAGVAVALYGLWQFVFGLSWFELRWLDSGVSILNIETSGLETGGGHLFVGGAIRPFSTLAGPVSLADYLAFASLLGIARYSARPRTNRWAEALLVLFLLGVLLLTRVRTGILVFLLGLAFFRALLSKKWQARRGLVAAALVLGGLVVIAQLQPTSPNPALATLISPGTFWGRIAGWKQVLARPGDYLSPVGTGMGAVSSAYSFSRLYATDNPGHSLFIEVAIELGWVGLGLYLWFFIRLLKHGLDLARSLPEGSEARVYAVSMTSILLGLVVAKSLSGGLWVEHIPQNYFWLLAGLLMGMRGVQSAHARVDLP